MNDSNGKPPAKRFCLGKLVATPGALAELERCGMDAGEFVKRHAQNDWGDLDDEDKRRNDDAIAHEDDPERQSRVFSAYRMRHGGKIWVITEADRSSTCVLLPDEY